VNTPWQRLLPGFSAEFSCYAMGLKRHPRFFGLLLAVAFLRLAELRILQASTKGDVARARNVDDLNSD